MDGPLLLSRNQTSDNIVITLYPGLVNCCDFCLVVFSLGTDIVVACSPSPKRNKIRFPTESYAMILIFVALLQRKLQVFAIYLRLFCLFVSRKPLTFYHFIMTVVDIHLY